MLRSSVGADKGEDLHLDSPAWGWFVLFWLTVFLAILHFGYSIYLWRAPEERSRLR